MRSKSFIFLISLMCFCCIKGSEIVSLPLRIHETTTNRSHDSTQLLRRLATDVVESKAYYQPLANDNNLLTVSIQVGKGQKSLDLLIDIGSDLMWVAQESVKFSNFYDCQAADECTLRSTDGKKQTITYANGSVEGYLGDVDISIAGLPIIQNSFLTVDQIKDYPKGKYSGLLGLSPSSETNTDKKAWVESYSNQKLIPRNCFSIFFSTDASKSELTLGGYNEKLIFNNNHPQPFQIVQNKKWALTFTGFQIGSFFTTQEAFKGQLILESSMTNIGVDKSLWMQINDTLVKNLNRTITTDDTFMSVEECSTLKWPDITLLIASSSSGTSRQLTLEPSLYIDYDSDEDTCLLKFQKLTMEDGFQIALGKPFFMKYMVTFQYMPAIITIVQSINKIDAFNPKPTPDNDSHGLPVYAYVLIGVGSALLVISIVGFIFWKKRRIQKQAAQTRAFLKDNQSNISSQVSS